MPSCLANTSASLPFSGDKVLVKDMKAPGYFGEMAFIVQSSQRFADVVAVGEVQASWRAMRVALSLTVMDPGKGCRRRR